MKDEELKVKIKSLERKLKEQQEDIDKLNKVKRRSKWWLAYLLWKS